MSLASEARRFLRSTRHGILSTHSVRHAGYPFGSVAPFVPDHAGNPLILISTLAEHTRNISADHRVSLLAFEGTDDLQANSRLTLVGEAEQTDKQDAVEQEVVGGEILFGVRKVAQIARLQRCVLLVGLFCLANQRQSRIGLQVVRAFEYQ